MPGGRASASSSGPQKRPHKVAGRTTRRSRAQAAAAEAVEGRERAKGKTGEPPRVRPQRRSALPRALDRRRQAAQRDHATPLTALWPPVDDSPRLREAYDGLQHEAAPGVDGQTWAASGEHLAAPLQDCSDRLKRGGAQARPVARVSSPKPAGRPRPRGIPPLDDQIVQRATVAVLTALYEGALRGFSQGWRPGRRPHEALDAVTGGMAQRPGNWVREADIRGCVEALDHAWRRQGRAHRIGDQRVLRHRQQWRHAGVLDEGQWHAQEEGTPHGGRGSPWAAQSSLPYVLDVGADRWRRPSARGDGIIVRAAADFIVGVAPRDAAERVWRALQERWGKCTLGRPPEQTRLSACGRLAVARRKRRAQGTPETCDLRGLTHTGRKPRNGTCAVRRKTSAQR